MKDTAETSRPYHHGDLKDALVRAGIETLEEVGLEKLSLRGIAARVGVSHTAPKNHFDGLRGLLSAIAAEGFRRHRAAMTEGAGADADPAARRHAAAAGYVRFARDNPALFRLMFSPALIDYGDPALKAAASASYDVLRGIADGLDWMAADGTRADAPRSELMLWSLVHGYAHLIVSGEVGGPKDGEPPSVLSILPDLRGG